MAFAGGKIHMSINRHAYSVFSLSGLFSGFGNASRLGTCAYQIFTVRGSPRRLRLISSLPSDCASHARFLHHQNQPDGADVLCVVVQRCEVQNRQSQSSRSSTALPLQSLPQDHRCSAAPDSSEIDRLSATGMLYISAWRTCTLRIAAFPG